MKVLNQFLTDRCVTSGPKIHIINLIIILSLSWIAYGKCLQNDFAWDDFGLIVNNDQIQSDASWHKAFFQNFWEIGENAQDPSRTFYRPLIIASYKLDSKVWGMNPFGFHMTNMLAHSICIILIYALGTCFLGRPILSLAATLLWAIHPTHVENVCWISGRTDVFSAVFFFLALLTFRLWAKRPGKDGIYFSMIATSYLFALLCKEIAIMLPVLCMAAYYLIDRKKYSFKRFGVLLTTLITISTFYMIIRTLVLGNAVGTSEYGTLWQKLISMPYIISRYAGLLLTAVPIDPHHGEPLMQSVFSWPCLTGIVVCLILSACLFYMYKKHLFLLLFLAAWPLICIAPMMNLGTFGDVNYADRFLYIPSAGFFFVVTLGISRFLTGKNFAHHIPRYISLIISLYIALLVMYSRYATTYWKDGATLFFRAARTSPDSAYIHYNLGNSLMQKGAYNEAYESYMRALLLHNSYKEVYLNLGATLNKLGRHKEAVKYLRWALKMNASPHVAYSNLGDAYMGMNNLTKAEHYYKLSLHQNETMSAHNNMGLCYIKMMDYDSAQRHFTQALRMKASPYTFNNFAKLALAQNNPTLAIEYLNKALETPVGNTPPDLYADIHHNIALLAEKTGNHEDSTAHTLLSPSTNSTIR